MPVTVSSMGSLKRLPKIERCVSADQFQQGDYSEQKLINEDMCGRIEALEDLAPL